jgi:hypothetical protein
MRGSIPPFPQYAFMAWCLIKYRDNFTFTFTFTFNRYESFKSYTDQVN